MSFTIVYGDFEGPPVPDGTVFCASSPRGDAVGMATVTNGVIPAFSVYGEDPGNNIPGMRTGEPVSWELDGYDITVEPDPFNWEGDWDIHPIVVAIDPTAVALVEFSNINNSDQYLSLGILVLVILVLLIWNRRRINCR